jgi:glyoxylase-like metal-dependent hydrolase (beta-lactamase superfamily II)
MEHVDAVHTLRLAYDLPDREDRLVVHPVAVETERGIVLVDTGIEGSTDRLAAAFEAAGLDFADVSVVFLTHHDWDHAGAAAAVVAETGATVVAPRGEAEHVDGRSPPLKGDPDDRYPPTPVDIEVVDGVGFRTRAGEMRVVGTPGHTPGHVSLYLPDERLLLSADALTSEDGLAGPKPEYTLDVAEAARSVGRLSELDVTRVVCFHGGPVEADADDIAAVHESMTS